MMEMKQMGFLAPSPPPTPGPDPELVKKQAEADAKAKKEREDEEARKSEEQRAFSQGFRGQRSLLSGDFTGFTGRSILGPTG